MNVRLFPDGRAFVHNHIIDIDPISEIEASSFIIPLNRDQVDINSIRIEGVDGAIYLSSKSLSVVTKENQQYIGNLIDYTDERVTISQGPSRIVIRNYDEIDETQYIMGRTSTGIIPSTLTVSYLTSGISGTIIHSLDVETGQLESDLIVNNSSSSDLENAQFEVITAEQAQRVFRYEASFNAAVASPQESSAGTIYRIDGRYDVPSGYEVSIPLIRNDIDASIVYVIDAPNGQVNATYTIRWISPVDLPPGSLYVYRGGELETVSSIDSTGEGQVRDIPLLVIPSVYARGTVSRTDTQPSLVQNGSTNARLSIATVRLAGMITNTLSEEILVLLRYFVGEGQVDTDTQAEREDQYIIFPLTIGPNSTQTYNYQFTITS